MAESTPSSSQPDAPVGGTEPTPSKVVHEVSGAKAAVLWLAGVTLRLWARTLRLEINRTEFEGAARPDVPVVFAFWHNRLFFATRLLRQFRPGRRVTGLVSASRDGAALAKFLSFLGVRTVRGSSSRFGREAVHSLVHELRAGYDVVVTPDGPRGPMYDMKPGVLLAASRAGAPVVLVGVACRPCFRLKSWDRFQIPWPGARMTVRCERIEPADLGHGHEALARLRSRLLALNGEPDAAGSER